MGLSTIIAHSLPMARVVLLGAAELAEEHVVTEPIVELGAASLVMELGDDGARGGARGSGARGGACGDGAHELGAARLMMELGDDGARGGARAGGVKVNGGA
jgi:hypothetical protein